MIFFISKVVHYLNDILNLHLVSFEHQIHVILFQSFILNNSSMEKNINIQQALFFSFLKKAKPIKQKKKKNEAIIILHFKSIWISS